MKNNKQSKKIILSVINDLVTDQRVNKVSKSLISAGYDVLLIGRKLSQSLKLNQRSYRTKRMKLLFVKGPLFYAEFNIRLTLHLLFKKADILIANDLDTLLANYLAYLFKRIINRKIQLIYDSHELFTEVPELNRKPIVKNFWKRIEKIILPKIKYSYTVCNSIAEYYKKQYKINMLIVRNLPECLLKQNFSYNIPENIPNKPIILYQGALNTGRGIEEMILAMKYIPDAVFLIAGDGDISDYLRNLTLEQHLEQKVFFLGKIPFENLTSLTLKAKIGIVLQKDISLSYHYVLPNRLFDLILAKVPIIASNLPELKQIVQTHDIGIIVDELKPELIALRINSLLNNEALYSSIKQHLNNTSDKFCWEKEISKLIQLINVSI